MEDNINQPDSYYSDMADDPQVKIAQLQGELAESKKALEEVKKQTATVRDNFNSYKRTLSKCVKDCYQEWDSGDAPLNEVMEFLGLEDFIPTETITLEVEVPFGAEATDVTVTVNGYTQAADYFEETKRELSY